MTASLPVFRIISGTLLKLTISDAPYPTPLLVNWSDVISPLKIGCRDASKVLPDIEDTPTLPITSTDIGGWLNLWVPTPIFLNSLNCSLLI